MSIIDEHAPRESESEYNSADQYEPTDQEREAIKKVEKFFKKSKKWRSNYDKDWIDNYKFFRGIQWREQRPSYRHSEVINLVFQSIQSVVPILTDSRPKFEFLPQDPSDIEFASIVNDVCEADWQKNSWMSQITAMLYDSHIYGVSYMGLYHDDDKEVTMGDLRMNTEDPLYVYPDPNCQDINDINSYGLVVAEPVDVELLKRQYANGKYVRGDLEDLSNYDKTDIDGYSKLRLPIDNTKVMRETSGSIDTLNVTKALKKTYYCFDEDYKEEQKTNELGEMYFEQREQYPRGRKIVVAGNVLLEDGPLEYEDGKIPLAKLVNYVLPREFFGISEIEQLKGPQKIFNKLISFALDVLTLMGNPIWIVGTDSGIDTENLFNKPGLIVEKNPNSEVRREEGVQLQPYVLQLVDRMKEWFDGISGAADVSAGIQPTGVTAASAISSLQEAAQTRLRLKSRNLDATLQQLGQMWLSRTLQYRDVPQMIRVTGNDGAQKYFKFHVQAELDEMGNPIMNEMGQIQKKAVVQNVLPGGMMQAPQEFPIKGILDVRVQTGSALPFMKAQKKADAMSLFQAQVIDDEELLKVMDWPNWQAVLQRVNEKRAQAAQEQMMAQQPPVAPDVPPAV